MSEANETKSEHTQGPWQAEQYLNNQRDDQWFPTDKDGALIFITDHGDISYTTKANANLIAAAPELEERLNALADMAVRAMEDSKGWYYQLKAEIELAEKLLRKIREPK